MATLDYTTRGAKSTSHVVDLLPDSIQAIWPYTSKKKNGKNWSVFKFGFVALLIQYNLREVLINNVAGRVKNNEIYLVLIATLESSQFVLVNKTSTLAQAWLALKSFYLRRGR